MLQSSASSALVPSSSSSSSSLLQQQQREEVVEEVSGALNAIISALRANCIINTTTTDSSHSHLFALSLLVSGGVVETLARLLQYAVHQPPATNAKGEAAAPLVITRCIRALALLTHDNNNNNNNNRDVSPMTLDLRGWLRAVSEESIARCVTCSSSK